MFEGRLPFATDLVQATGKTPPLETAPCNSRQARQDLNPQPLVLETSALPIELLAYGLHQASGCTRDAIPDTWLAIPSFCLAMRRMLAATRAVFIQFHAARIISAVLLGCVITLFTLRAGQGYYRADILL